MYVGGNLSTFFAPGAFTKGGAFNAGITVFSVSFRSVLFFFKGVLETLRDVCASLVTD